MVSSHSILSSRPQNETFFRKVVDLESVEFAQKPPSFARRHDLSSNPAARKGKGYEKKFGRWLARQNLGEVHSQRWLNFRDANGWGYAQPDFFIPRHDRILLFECKLTQVDDCHLAPQVLDLYSPLLEELYGVPTVIAQVCRNLRYRPSMGLSTLEDLLASPRPVMPRTIHWLPQE